MMKTYKKVFTLLIFLIITIQAQWSTDPNNNTAICTALNKQTEVSICSDIKAGAFICWRDYRDNSGIFEGDIYAQHLEFGGNPLWTVGGLVINNVSGGQFRPQIVSDEKGGAIIVWAKSSGGFYGYDIYAQRVDANGNLLWNPNGVAIAVSSATDSFQEIIPDGGGGVIITWQRLPTVPGKTDIYAQRVDSIGAAKWTTNGVMICTAIESQVWPKLVSDQDGGAIIAWEDGRSGSGTNNIYAQRVNKNGIAQWTTDGVPICDDDANQSNITICSDGQNGAIIVWEDYRTGTSNIYGQRVNADGQVLWDANGKFLSPISSTCKNPMLIFDDLESIYAVWENEVQSNETNIESQKVDSNGNLLWGNTGVAVCNATGNQNEVSVIKNMADGIIVCWKDARINFEGDIYVQWIDAEGNIKWTVNGVEICNSTGDQSYPVLTTDGLEGAIISWVDLRNGTTEDIYAQNIDYRGKLGTTNNFFERNINKTITNNIPTIDTLIIPLPKRNEIKAIYDVTVKIGSVVHDNINDLELRLTHNGIFDTLIYRIDGNGGINFKNTYLNENLGNSFDGATAPFEGIYKPHNPISNLSGSSISGEWILTVIDHKSGDDGFLQNWGLLISESTLVGVDEDQSTSPNSISLFQNYPNPFNPSTTISWQMPETGLVSLKVYDLLGREVITLINKELNAGKHEVEFDASQFCSGIYFYQLRSGRYIQTKKMILLK